MGDFRDIRKPELRPARVKLLLSVVALDVLIVATFLTSSPRTSPASGWEVTINRLMYATGFKSSADMNALHAGSRNVSSEDCIACHGSMKSSRVEIHRIHLVSDLVRFECHDCHDHISLEKKSNEKVVHMVRVGFCKKCHSRFAGFNKTSAMKPVDFQAECTRCHTGDHAPKHARSYLIPAALTSKNECVGCHGGRILPWTPEHETAEWIQRHGPMALEMGRKKCMQCHNRGLRFCRDCHLKKPPTHKPKDVWLGTHWKKARQETRACLTCHKTAFCQRCHKGHTRDWRRQHFRVVQARGAATCRQCHNSMFCEGCHVSRTKKLPGVQP